jgi:hypothetical protein
VPEQLRGVLRANQQDGYALLMKAAAHAIIDIARTPPPARQSEQPSRWLESSAL